MLQLRLFAGVGMQRAKVLIVLTLLVLGFGLATGFPVFFRMFYVFGLLLVIGLGWTAFLVRGMRVDVARANLRTIAGQSIAEHVHVRRTGRLLQGFIEVRESTTMPIEPPGAVIGLGGSTDMRIGLDVPCPVRGVFRLGPIRVTASDPLGLYKMEHGAGRENSVIVHPETVDLPNFVLLPADLPAEGSVRRRSQHSTTNAYGIRDYYWGDSLNRISWKATARHDRLMVKEFEVEPANNIWVLADMERRANAGPAGRDIEETAVRVAASICRRYSEGGYPVGFIAHGDERFVLDAQRGSDHLMHIMDALAAIRALGTRPLLDMIADLHTRVGRYTSVALVTASPDDEWLDGVRHLLQRHARVTAVIVDGDPARGGYPDAAYRTAATNTPTYVIKAGARAPEDLIAVAHGSAGRPFGGFAPGRAAV